MGVQILSKETIKPSSPTPIHLKTYKLSLLDQFAPSLYMPFIFFYPNKFLSRNEIFLTQLKESLSQVLTIYYPLAGRLNDGAAATSAAVDCNDEGVEFIEAQTTGSLSEFLKRPDISALNSFLPCNADVLEKGSNIAPAKIKATVFNECGGIVVGICVFHKIGDAATAATFLKSWAQICRNEKVECPNFTFGSETFPARETLPSDFISNFDNFFFKGSRSLQMRRFVFDPTAIKALKNKAASENVPNPTRVEALTAFVVKHMNAAGSSSSNNNNSSVTTLMITHAVNLRRRIEPMQPDNTFGNILWLAFAFYECCINNNSNIINSGDLVETLSEALVSLDKESVLELEAEEAFESLSQVMGSVCANEKIKIYRFTSWCNMGFYDVNFGWGNPIWVAHMGNINSMDAECYRSKQQFVFIESGCNGKSIELWLAADEQQLSVLENDTDFLAYATPNPSISVD